MHRIVVLLLCALFMSGSLFADTASEITVERQRIDGHWRVVCTTAHPSKPEEIEKLSEELKRRCKREADMFGSRQHLTSGALLRANVGPVETDEKKTTLTVNVDLVTG